MYIPPPGVVQFLLNAAPSYPIWVSAKPWTLHTRMPSCTCAHGFLVVHSERFTIGSVPPGSTPAVCFCLGNFIE